MSSSLLLGAKIVEVMPPSVQKVYRALKTPSFKECGSYLPSS
ncbi:MAG: hypothetical protein ACW98W_02235 [Candidatus Hodarchaeales archaeon]